MNTRFFAKLFLIILCALPVSFSVQAQLRADTHGVEISIIDDRGQEFRQYPLSWRSPPTSVYRAYLEAIQGKNYAIQVRNRNNRRIGLVIAVDGRNIISGDKSYLRRNERMYILEPYQEATYRGWRTSQHRINQFYFTDAEDSYAGAWSDYTAMGVIAVAVYPQKQEYQPWSLPGKEGAREKNSRQAPRILSEPGTGFGDKEWSPSRKVDFEPAEEPLAKYFIKYEWREALCRKGIIACRSPGNRFWDDRAEEHRYVPYPPQRRY